MSLLKHIRISIEKTINNEHRLILNVLDYYKSGSVTAVQPIKVFRATETQDAFRYMQKGQHIGRIGISLRSSDSQNTANESKFETVPRIRPTTFSNSASYLLVGGLGGLGRAIASWMVDLGARELLFLSRSAGTDPKHAYFVNELNSTGCSVKLIKGDVTRPEDVSKAIQQAEYPLKGVIQMTMVLRDQNFEKMTFAEWDEAIAPKVQGTWNLHNVTTSANTKLDFFVLFSSLSGIVGQPGQANYASANTFLDAIVQYRQSLGLAASAVDIGAVEDIGYITQSPGLMNKMKSKGFKGVTEQELLDAMALAMSPCLSSSSSSTNNRAFARKSTFVLGLGSTMPLSSPGNSAIWRRDRRMAIYHNSTTTAGGASGNSSRSSSNEAIKTLVAACLADPQTLLKINAETAHAFGIEIGRKLFDLLLKPHDDLNTTRPLTDLGLDSLVAIELKAWWKQVFGFNISVLEMLGMGSLDALGEAAAEGLLKRVSEGRGE